MRWNRGFTLIEMLVTVAVAAILLSAAVPSFQNILGRSRLTGAANQLYGDFQYARSESVQRNTKTAVTFDTAGWCYIVHTVVSGATCTCSATGAGSCTGTAVNLKNVKGSDFSGVTVALSGGVTAFTFEPVRGGLDGGATGGNVTFTGVGGNTMQAQLNALGRVRLCVPSGSAITGYSAC